MQPLFDPGPTDRQFKALVYVLGEPVVQIVDVGRALHAHEGCEWCFSDAISVLAALEERGLVEIHRGTVRATRAASKAHRRLQPASEVAA